MVVFSKLYNAFRGKIHSSGSDNEKELGTRCIYCSRKERLRSFTSLKRGDHICMGGQHLVINIGDSQVAAYTHHAIVKSVEVTSASSADVTLIHFYTTPHDPSIRIQETKDILDLHYHEIYTIRYRHQTHSADTIISRAEGLIEQNKDAKYSILSCNCEHFCNWCCIGSESSYQADTAKDALKEVENVYSNVLRGVLKLALLSIEDLSMAASIAVPWGMLGVMALLYLIFTIYQHIKLNNGLSKGNICSACCKHKKQELWIKFAAYCALQAGGLALLSLVIAAGVSGGIVAGVLLVCSILSLACISAVPKLRKLFCSPFQGRLVRVKSMKQIWIGDVISFDQWKISHDGIVSAVQIYPETREKKGQVKVIHYSLPKLFGRRTVVEDVIEFDLGKHLIHGHDYAGYKCHEPEIVLYRARQRLGETKFGLMSNRSCHFCHWAKVDEDQNEEDDVIVLESSPLWQYLEEVDPKDTISNLPSQSLHIDHQRGRKQASKLIDRTWARIRDDIKPGQIVEFKYSGFRHKAVSTKVSFDNHDPSIVSVTVVHYGKLRNVCEEAFIFHLKYEDVWIYKYHPLYRHRKDDVIRRARARIGDGNYNILRHRSSQLAREIVVKDKNPTVTDIGEIKRGDVITFYYWSFEHDAVVANITHGDSKANTTGKLMIIHYAQDHLFKVRTVKEQCMSLDLKKDLVYLKGYDGYITYPTEMVVKRARSRVGEQRFAIRGNTSSDLVHWAKVVQTPVVVSKSSGVASKLPNTAADKQLLVPKAGKQCEGFQCFRVNSWSDLYPGVIVEYRYYWILHQGILSDMDEQRKRIKVIHYGADHLFATRTIMEDSMKLDLRRDNIWIYRGHPRQCYKAGVVLGNARRRLGEKSWRAGNRSWDFCKDCVLKNRFKEV